MSPSNSVSHSPHKRAKVNKLAGRFNALLCVGQFFPDSPDRLDEFTNFNKGQSRIPVPTYFIGDYGIGAPKFLSAATKDLANLGFKMDGLKICENPSPQCTKENTDPCLRKLGFRKDDKGFFRKYCKKKKGLLPTPLPDDTTWST
ncbi:hypothetical protein RJ639_032528 [Escallonia herrerae]|uniref:Uncharacterized protein n=1 Tax=Escallonia herrerae TaxID=1293975 RepID=A0AA89BL34_9ASTE|nr:hypothetical protein RJ639_032528 [Escallonia herrerae]